MIAPLNCISPCKSIYFDFLSYIFNNFYSKTLYYETLNWLIILLIGATSFVSSCKKKDKVNTCTLNEANFSGSYKIESVKYKASPTSPEIDGTSLFFDPCELDDVTTFNTNHTYTYADAGTACAPKVMITEAGV